MVGIRKYLATFFTLIVMIIFLGGVALYGKTLRTNVSPPEQVYESDLENITQRNWEEFLVERDSLTEEEVSFFEELTKTDILSRESFATLIELQNTGRLTPTQLQIASNNIVYDIVSSEKIAWLPSEIRTTENTQGNFKNYGNALGRALHNFNNKGLPEELSIIGEATEALDFSLLEQLSAHSNLYSDFVQELSQIPVPTEMVNTHLSLLNGNDLISKALFLISTTSVDPVGGLMGFSFYDEGAQSGGDAYMNILGILKEKNISFSPEEPGSILGI